MIDIMFFLCTRSSERPLLLMILTVRKSIDYFFFNFSRFWASNFWSECPIGLSLESYNCAQVWLRPGINSRRPIFFFSEVLRFLNSSSKCWIVRVSIFFFLQFKRLFLICNYMHIEYRKDCFIKFEEIWVREQNYIPIAL